MTGRSRWAALLAVWALTAPAAGAMPIAQYDRLSSDDQSRYTTLLMTRTIAYLYAQRRDEDAAKLRRIFNGDEEVAQIAIDDGLETARRRERETGTPLEVEYAVSLALADMDIQVTTNTLKTLMPDFRPAERRAP